MDQEPLDPVDLLAVDDTDTAGTLSRAAHDLWSFFSGEPEAVTGFHGVPTMVDGVLAAAGNRPIDSLRIDDHATPGSQTIGDRGSLTVDGLADAPENAERLAALAALSQQFTEDGTIQLGGCNVGQGEEGEALARRMAEVTGVTIEAGEQFQRPLLPGLDGTTITCSPTDDGTVACERNEAPVADLVIGLLDGVRELVN